MAHPDVVRIVNDEDMEIIHENIFYLVSEDDGQTAFLLWRIGADTTHYLFKFSESLACQDNVEWAVKAVGEISIPHGLWSGDKAMLPFGIMKVIYGEQTSVSLGKDSPTVYDVPDSE